MNWIMNLSIGEIAYVMLGFGVFVMALKIVVEKLTEDEEKYEEDED